MPSLGSHQCSTANKQPKPHALTPREASLPHPHSCRAHLVQCCQAILIGQVRANPTTKELANCKKRKAGRVLKS